MTDAAIGKLKPRRKRYAVTVARGLQLVVHPSGGRSWIFRYRLGHGSFSVKMGTWPAMKLGKARKMAARWTGMVADSIDPKMTLEGPGTQVNVREFAKRWIAEVVVKVRRNPRPVERMLEREVFPTLGQLPVARITVKHVRELIFKKRDKGHPEAAAALRHLLKRLFDYAVACEAAPANPARAIPLKFVTRHKARKRSLTERELRIFLQRLTDPTLKHLGWALELMLLTLCRKSELRLARWDELDLAQHIWEIPFEHSKTGQPHIVYLSPRAVELFRHLKGAAGNAECVLPKRDSLLEPMDPATINKAMARVKWGIAHFTPHDLRRTASTLLNEQGYNRDVVEKALNHEIGGVRGTYNRAAYREERIRMLREWAEYLEGLKNG